MKHIGKRVLSMLCALTMLLSLMAMIVPGAFAESTTTNEIDAIPSGHLAAVRYYSDFATEAGKTAYVDDAEAYGGKAVCYSLANFDGGDFLAIKRYDGGKEVSIKQMFKDDLYINEGYHTYKITYDVPADATEGAVFFLMPNWQLNSSAFCKDFAPYAGQTVEVYLSIKVTGPAANGLYSVSVDRVALATICDDYMSEDGSTCTACGKQDALLAGIPSDHRLKVADYTIFREHAGQMTSYVEDQDAYNGKAVCHVENNANVKLELSTGGTIGSISADALKINQGYQLHKFTFNVPADITAPVDNEKYVFFMSSWQFQSSDFYRALVPYAGQTVEIYISMKVTGPADSMYSICVDRVALATACAMNDEGVCSVCGKMMITQDEMELIVLQKAGQLYADYRAAVSQDLDGAGGKVTDSDAKNQTAIKAGPYNLSETGFRFYAYGNDKNILLDSIAPGRLKVNQGYQLYKLSMVIPDTLANAACTYGIADNNWQFVSFNAGSAVKAFVGKQLDVYISLKVTGSLDAATCYIDRMVFVDSCANYVDRDGSCAKCGKTVCTKAEAELNVLRKSGQVYADYFATVSQDLDGAGGKVTDSDAKNQTAIAYGPYNLSETGFRFYGYSATNGNILLDSVAPGQLKVDQGYQLYKLSAVIPATLADAAATYFVADTNWQFVSFNAKSAVQAFVGKQLDVYISLKVTGSLEEATCYIDQMIFVDSCENHMNGSGVCTLCGKMDAMLNQIPEAHRVVVRDSGCFTVSASEGTTFEADIEAYNESAVRFSRADLDHLISDEGENKNFNDYISLHHYYNGSVDNAIGNLYKEDMKIDQGYHIYKFTYEVPENATNDGVVYLIPNWQINSAMLSMDLYAYAGQTVDIYLSIKVTKNTDNELYSIWVDRVAFATACQWGEGVVTTAPTYETEGVMTYTCSVCGETKTETIDKLVEPTPVESWGLILGENIGMNFVLKLTEEQILEALIEVRVAGKEEFYIASELVDMNTGKAVLKLDLAAAQMTEEIEIILYVGEQEISKTYTVRQYADYVLDEANGFDDVTKDMVKYMLSYGAAAQKYFDYNPDALADAGITVKAVAVPTEGGTMEVNNDGIDNVSFYGATLVYRDKIAVRYYYTADSLDGILYTENLIAKGGKYYVEIDGIYPHELDRVVDYSVRADNEGTLSVCYSPLTYIIRMYNKADTTQATKDLVQALYGYYLAADAYASRSVT